MATVPTSKNSEHQIETEQSEEKENISKHPKDLHQSGESPVKSDSLSSENKYLPFRHTVTGEDDLLNNVFSFCKKQLFISRFSNQRRRAVLFLSALIGSVLGALWEHTFRIAVENTFLTFSVGSAVAIVGIRLSSSTSWLEGALAAVATLAVASSSVFRTDVLVLCGAVTAASVTTKIVEIAETFFEVPRSEKATLLISVGAFVLGFIAVPLGVALVITTAAAAAGVLVGLGVGVGLGRVNINFKSFLA